MAGRFDLNTLVGNNNRELNRIIKPPWLKTFEETSLYSQTLNNPTFGNLQRLQKNLEPLTSIALKFERMGLTTLPVYEVSKISKSFRPAHIERLIKTVSNFNKFRTHLGELRTDISSVIDSDSLRNITRLNNFPYPELKRLLDEIEQTELAQNYPGLSANNTVGYPDGHINEISKELVEATDYSQLSNKAKSALYYIIFILIIPTMFNHYVNQHIDSRSEAKKTSESEINSTNSKKISNSQISKIEHDIRALFRCTTSNSLKLQALPLKQSEVKSILPAGSLIYVIDSSHKSWLFVDVKIGGQSVNGWVLRRYTRRLI